MTSAVEKALDHAFQLSGKIDRAFSKSTAIAQVAESYMDIGNISRCLETLHAAVKSIERVKHPDEKARLLSWVAGLYAEAGEKSRAKDLFNSSILLAHSSEPTQMATTLIEITRDHFGSGFLDDADRVLSELSETVKAFDKPEEISCQLINITELFNEMGCIGKAKNTFKDALAAISSIKNNWLHGERMLEIAEIYQYFGAVEEVNGLLEEVLSCSADDRHTENWPFFTLRIVDVYLELGQKQKACDMLSELLERIDREQLPYSASGDLIDISGKYAKMGYKPKASEVITSALELIEEIDKTEDRIERLTQVSSMLCTISYIRKALDIAGQALNLVRGLSNKRTAVHLMGELALVYARLGNRTKSEEIVNDIVIYVAENKLKTSGLGALAIDFSSAREYLSAARLAALVKEPEIKVGALTAIVACAIEENYPLEGEFDGILGQMIAMGSLLK